MKTKKANIDKASGDNFAEITRVNPFKKLMEDKQRIADAVNNGLPLSTLKNIKFIRSL